MDATALYLFCLMKEMPTGYYSRRKAEDGFELKQSHPYGQMTRGWLEWLAYSTNHIIHEHKVGKEVRIGWKSISVDGYSKETRTVYQFHGCMVHGHDCWLTRISKDTSRETSAISGKSMEELRLDTEKMMQYLIYEGYHVIEMRECGGIKKNTKNM